MLTTRIPPVSAILLLLYSVHPVQSGFYKFLGDAFIKGLYGGWDDGWQSKGITFGLKSKGMTAIIPVPLPIPMFSKDKGGGGGGGGGEKIKYIPVPVPSGGGKGEDWW